MDDQKITLLLGELRGEVRAMNKQVARNTEVLDRLELNSVKSGGTAGTLAGVGVALIIEALKQKIGMS